VAAPRIDQGPKPLPRHRLTLRTWRSLLAAAVLVAVANGAGAAAPGVLILHSNQRPTPAAIVVEDTLRSVVPQRLSGPVEIFSEYLDDEWSSTTYAAAEAEFFREKYEARNIRVIVASAAPALQFALTFRERMLPGVPVVHIAIPRDALEHMVLPRDVVGHPQELDPAATIRFALRLHPKAKHLVVVLGAAERDRTWGDRVRAALGRVSVPLEVEYLSGLPTAEILRRVGSLSRDTIVFTPGYFVDGSGEIRTPRKSAELIAQASTAPVYGTLDTFLGAGVVGGYMTPYDQQAKEAGAIVASLLAGRSPKEIQSSPAAQVPMVDWRQLQRWRIDEKVLPPGTIVMFHEPTVWDRYGLEISIGMAVLLLQAGLIAALLVERRIRRRTATELNESQEQMSLAARAAGLSLWIWDTARNKVRASGWSRARSRAKGQEPVAFDAIIASAHPADRENLRRAVAKALDTGEELEVEYRVVAADGTVRWLVVRGRAERGDSMRLIGIALDVTERKAADLRAAHDRTALRHMTRVATMGQLSAAIAHQLNQPLAAILGNAEAAQKLLGREPIDLAELKEICADIVRENHRAADVIRRLSELYKRGDMTISPIDLNAMVRGTLDLLHTELLMRHVTPMIDLAASVLPIEGGHVQLQQVLLNLVLNAADAMSEVKPDERRLLIRTESSNVKVRLYVIDNGSGIAQSHLKSVFDPFWTTKPDGMGMGLAICQSIVAAHRGTITATNNAEGGATFCVILPASRAP
jgi:C4-dicarboxylate-specific signal transduction histidine kinase/ABC-type uncharacterized transport system substrate-binding protein